ncbi:lysoplasmalogenase [Shimia abyssi]|uniref:YhhN-like protein n=1 Tax=Shimia abyssi TaxID=1662395 RepID=A0A2P8FAT7_9RHOB|nr:lysoplasmalogenase [Shimia abyssi]PSL18835.1 YhhN-like protein [Shimia abyssi]
MTFVEEIALRQSVRLVLLVVGALGALVYLLFFCHRERGWARVLFKVIPMPAFAGAAVVSFGNPLVIWGLALSAVGDVALTRKRDRWFLIGLVAFACAHLAYIAHFIELSGGVFPGFTLSVAVVLVLAASTEVWLTPHTGGLRWPVRGYVVLIAAMGITALSLPSAPLATIGAMLFIASDTLLAVLLFRMNDASRWQRPMSMALWLFYASGQFLILAGVGWSTPLFQIG